MYIEYHIRPHILNNSRGQQGRTNYWIDVMRDECNFRSRRAGRSATIKTDYRNYRCPISDVCLCSHYPHTLLADQKLVRLFCTGYVYEGWNGTINQVSKL